MREPARLVATPSQTVGPFFHFGLADDATRGVLADESTKGERIALRIRVLDGDEAAVPDALLEIWQADADGRYVRPTEAASVDRPPAFTGFGRLPTNADGTCVFQTIRPGRIDNASGRPEASHINILLFARGLLRHLCTRVYLDDADALERDPILGEIAPDRRHTLIARRSDEVPGEWRHDIRLQGDGETVFFDL